MLNVESHVNNLKKNNNKKKTLNLNDSKNILNLYCKGFQFFKNIRGGPVRQITNIPSGHRVYAYSAGVPKDLTVEPLQCHVSADQHSNTLYVA